jgi:hypothetical protein
MGQFHSDFSSNILKGNIYSAKFIALGKKCYIDELRSSSNPNEVDYHIRMKGIPNNAIMSYCESNKITPIDLYTKLFNGESIKFDLCTKVENGINKQFTRLKKRNNFEYFNITDMTRTLKF